MKNKNHKTELDVLVYNLKNATFIKDKNRKYTFVNPAMCKLFKLSSKEIIGKTEKEIFSKENAKTIREIDNLSFKGKKIDETILILLQEKQFFFHVMQAPIKNSKNVIIGISGSITNITHETELREELITLSSIAKQSKEGIAIADLDGLLVFANDAWCKMHSYKNSKNLIGKNLSVFHNKEQLKNEVIPFNELAMKNETHSGEVGHITKSGTIFPTLMTTTLLKDASNEPFALSAIAIDITKQKEIEKRLKESEEKYRLLYETSSDAIMTLEPPTWKFTSGNSAIIKMFNVKNEEKFTSLPPWKLSPKYQPDGESSSVKAKKMIGLAMKNGKHYFEWTHKKLNGDDFFATVLLNRVDSEDKSFLQARVTDISEKKKIENEITKTTERFEDIAKNSGDMIWEINSLGEYTYISGKVRGMLGYSPKEIIGKTPFHLMSEKEACRVSAIFNQIKKTKKPIVNLENWNVSKTGKEICISTNGVPIFDVNKNIIGYRGVDKDITKEKLSEQKEEREAKNYELLSSIGMKLNITDDFTTSIKKVLQELGMIFAIERIVGFTVDSERNIASKSFAWSKTKKNFPKTKTIDLSIAPSFTNLLRKNDIIIADDIKQLPNDLYIFLKSRKVKSVLVLPIKPFKVSNGFICFHSVKNYKKWEDEEIKLLRIIANMLSQALERQIIRNETIEEKNKLKKTLYNIGDAVIVIDSDLKVRNFNKVASQITGIAKKDILNQKFDKKLFFVHSESKEKTDQFILDVFATGKAQTMGHKTVLINKKGENIPIADSATPLKDSNGNVTGCVVIFRDITLQQEIDKMKTEFVSIASHQLRTPLGGIKWSAELLKNESLGKLNLKQKKAINNISISNERMITLVNDLLNVSRMEEGEKLIIKRKPTDICKIIKSILDENSILIKTNKITIKQSRACKKYNEIILNIDKKRIEQTIHNILNNAIKYSKKNSKIVIDIRQTKEKVTFAIKDSGVGIPKREHKHIFEKFFRADNVQLLHTGGTGLGLYIAKMIIEAHDGKIWFESNAKKGTTFYFTLPR